MTVNPAPPWAAASPPAFMPWRRGTAISPRMPPESTVTSRTNKTTRITVDLARSHLDLNPATIGPAGTAAGVVCLPARWGWARGDFAGCWPDVGLSRERMAG